MSFENLFLLTPKTGDGLQSLTKLITEVSEGWGCSFRLSSVILNISKMKTILSYTNLEKGDDLPPYHP